MGKVKVSIMTDREFLVWDGEIFIDEGLLREVLMPLDIPSRDSTPIEAVFCTRPELITFTKARRESLALKFAEAFVVAFSSKDRENGYVVSEQRKENPNGG